MQKVLFLLTCRRKKKKNRDLLKRRFRITVKRIEGKDDDNSVSSQITDFSESTINRLIEEGKEDARNLSC